MIDEYDGTVLRRVEFVVLAHDFFLGSVVLFFLV